MPLRRRFRTTHESIRQAYATLAEGVERKRDPSPAELWLLDNSHVVEGQLREIDEDLPWGYLVQLPRMSRGPMRGYPLVYGLCLEYLRHTDSHVDLDTLVRFVNAYQIERVLTIGELWAIPIMLRLGLVLSVSALASSEARASDRDWADSWSKKILDAARSPLPEGERTTPSGGPESVVAELERWRQRRPPSDAFLVTLLRKLRERDDAPAEALDWIAQQTNRLGISPEELARRYHLRQAADQVSVGNAITSMRSINTLNWSTFFGRTSHVEAILRRDPGDVYAQMDDASRDRCRHAVEKLARSAQERETVIAEAALTLATAQRDSPEDYRAHVGYYLLDEGRAGLYRKLSFRPKLGARLGEFVFRHPAFFYLSAICLLTLGLTALAWAALSGVLLPLWLRALLVPAMLFAASEIAVAVVNAGVIALVPPRTLPRFEFAAGIPAAYPTLVVVPTLLDEAGLPRLLEELEVRSLSNTDENLYFALLTDFPDAAAETLPGDAELLERAQRGIERLNDGHPEPRFFLLHRRRSFAPAEGNFRGWERKRGKLAELNHLLRGATTTSFSLVTAPSALLQRIRYVITVDTDTELPLGVARRLVATLAHPLNRPWFDEQQGRIRRGYSLIQPRVGTSPMSARQSIFARLTAGPPGIDPYTTAVSDVYQDLFAEGSFVGKGIYDVDAFMAAMAGRCPEEQLLSHDLIESIYARSALASDIEVLDEQPAQYAVAAGRQHRWIRGDWQLLPWLWPRVPGTHARRPYDLRAFDAWRVLDNLRRSLLPPALIVLSAATWLSGFRTAWVGTMLLVAVFVVPVCGRLMFAFFRSDSQLDWLGGLGGDLKSNAKAAFLSLVFLLDQALVSLDAILRALYRQFVSGQHKLEWTSMRVAAQTSAAGLLGTPRLLLAAGSSVALAALVVLLAAPALPFSAPILALWALSPWMALWVSRIEPKVVTEPWGEQEVQAFRRIARKTWRFFEHFVGDMDHHLPPDNYQEDPRGIVAHRTSPTNMGLYLLSVVAARDLGFISLHEATRRLSRSLLTIENLEKREGHVLNWYDTRTLEALEPRYVSTVDSGNLAGYLLTLGEAYRDARASPLLSDHILAAALDAARLAQDAAEREERPNAADVRRVRDLCSLLEQTEAARRERPSALPFLIARASREVAALLLWHESHDAPREVEYWLRASQRTLEHAAATISEHLPHVAWLDARLRHLRDAASEREWQSFEEFLHEASSPERLASDSEALVSAGKPLFTRLASETCLLEFQELVLLAGAKAREQLTELDDLAARTQKLVDEMDFTFLYDEDRALFSIGYNVSSARIDGSHYDLLASEARLASLVAIAKGDVPAKHWYRLGRLRAKYARTPGLLSWSGSMFEYLMPLLVTRSYPDTLLDQTCHAVVARQIEYARAFGVPWGVSESAYNVMDLSMNYQYRAFGVPGLGLKPGLGEDLVVAPYATALAALVRARAAATNFEALRQAGIEGHYGFYEAVDYTPSRLPPSRTRVVVKAYMAHHQGMTLVALANLLTDFAMQRRFHADPRMKACALLLEERIPLRAGVVHPETPRAASTLAAALDQDVTEHIDLWQIRAGERRGHLLGQGALSSWITSTGEGFLSWRGVDVLRFREDAALGAGGIHLYLQNLDRGHFWSAGYMPTRAQPNHYDAVFSVDKVELGRRDGDIETLTEITLSPEHPAEVRRLTLTNHAAHDVRLAVTSLTELCLAPRAADVAHPAFQKLFLETEYSSERGVLLGHRRKRSSRDPEVWVAQMFVGGDVPSATLAGTSRSRFLGRGGSLASPRGLGHTDWAGQTSGALDPAFVLRREFTLEAGGQVRFSLVTLVGESRAAVLEQVDHFSDAHSVARSFEFAWADARVELRHLGINSAKARRYQQLLSAVLFPRAQLREEAHPPDGTRGRDALWSQGISGDLPIVVLRLDETDFADLCRDALLAHEAWRLSGVLTDLVILNEEAPSYLQPVQDAVLSLIRSTPAEGHLDQRGGLFLRRTALIAEEDLQLILSAARVVLRVSKGPLSAQLRALTPTGRRHPKPPASRRDSHPPALLELPQKGALVAPGPQPELAFANGLGGFDGASGEYVMTLRGDQLPPQPWSNVMANAHFGALVTESGAGFTWLENSQRHRLTPWSNDPTLDPAGELFFVRDLDTGEVWSLTPAPAGGDATFEVRHGQGHSSFRHSARGLEQALEVAVDPTDPVKVWRISLTDRSGKARRLSVCAYAEWTLGSHREVLRVSTSTSYRPELRTIFARNPFSPFPKSRAFLTSTKDVHSLTADREEFFGPSGSRARPAALTRPGLSGHVGANLDPCAALEVAVSLEPGSSAMLAFTLGAGSDERHAVELAARYSEQTHADAVLTRAREHWQGLLGRVRIKTPDPALDLMMNHWLPYQVLSCRFWGRSGFFQSGGAYGFRDQLQDSMALLHLRPDLTRAQLLLAASRQFLEGDVQHWWHPDTGEGVRTHCSDDLLWLPWAAVEYATATQDESIWDESVGFLQDRLLEPDKEDLYGVPPTSAESAPLYEHCVRALRAGLTRGEHGLPLMRGGDWNDGMNRIGAQGRGESVWLAWFLASVLGRFAEVAERRGDRECATWCRSESKRLTRAVEAHAWDGAWYRRATFDDGSPVGSGASVECRIDAIAQSWAVVSRLARPDRATQALNSSLRHLWDRRDRLMVLLTPPFAGRGPDPGYIAGYPLGIRENGGQYTHGVLWTVLALLLERRGAEAYELLSDLNPISHTSDAAQVAKYQVEPYVVAADVYSEPPHRGRGGWTWYTGSAAWMYRIALEKLLGLERRGDALAIDPCVPPTWPAFEVEYRSEAGGVLAIRFENPDRVSQGTLALWLDGVQLSHALVPLPAAGKRQMLLVRSSARKSGTSRPPNAADAGTPRAAQR